ncbi:hypothetical protein [uncultured Chitinophaga sp.]|uniref:hypothetical protein n=1 Tax=uncultured Chitinophaga sp. TaxID=339340 RepID=UPI0025F800F0|nr:hypothetical protein [uncultured Chitinophaga sp.]
MQRFMLKMNAIAVLLISLFSLSAKAGAGGEYYRIFLNNKLILERNVLEPLSMKDLPLDNVTATDHLVVYYSHCGSVGKGRSITIRDENGKVLKEWNFADTDDKKAGMTIPVKELLAVKKANNGVLNLHYAAKELPKGRMLAGISSKSRTTGFNEDTKKESTAITTVLR